MVSTSSKKRKRSSNSEDGSEREYQVEAILDKRIRGKKTQYLLKWKGYSNEDNTWEDEGRLNCPDLVEDFEERLKTKVNEGKSSSKSKNTNRQDTDEAYQSDANQSTVTESGTDSTRNDDDDDRVIVTRRSPRKKTSLSEQIGEPSPTTRRHSSRKIVNQTKSNISSMYKNESLNDDIIEEESSPAKKSKNNNSSSPEINNIFNGKSTITVGDFPDESPTIDDNLIEPAAINLRLRITPSSTSSISLTHNDSDNNNNKEQTFTENNLNDQVISEIIDETDQVEKIEAVRNAHGEISFHMKLVNENKLQWISSKIANRKYPQAVIAFWENHVEFT